MESESADTTINNSKEGSKPTSPSSQTNNNNNNNSVVKFKIGSREYQCSNKAIFNSNSIFGNTLLGRMFSESNAELFKTNQEGQIELESPPVDPRAFPAILRYYESSGKELVVPDALSVQEFKKQLDYFAIPYKDLRLKHEFFENVQRTALAKIDSTIASIWRCKLAPVIRFRAECGFLNATFCIVVNHTRKIATEEDVTGRDSDHHKDNVDDDHKNVYDIDGRKRLEQLGVAPEFFCHPRSQHALVRFLEKEKGFRVKRTSNRTYIAVPTTTTTTTNTSTNSKSSLPSSPSSRDEGNNNESNNDYDNSSGSGKNNNKRRKDKNHRGHAEATTTMMEMIERVKFTIDWAPPSTRRLSDTTQDEEEDEEDEEDDNEEEEEDSAWGFDEEDDDGMEEYDYDDDDDAHSEEGSDY